jgi:hypothetical protein
MPKQFQKFYTALKPELSPAAWFRAVLEAGYRRADAAATRKRRNRCREPSRRSRGGPSEPCDGESSPAEKELWKCRVPQLRRAAPGKVENQNQRPENNLKKESIAQHSVIPQFRISGSPRIGNETHFQAHSALESNIDFRLTFGLENASHGRQAKNRLSHLVTSASRKLLCRPRSSSALRCP